VAYLAELAPPLVFADLPTADARAHFHAFLAAWNGGQLADVFYDGRFGMLHAPPAWIAGPGHRRGGGDAGGSGAGLGGFGGGGGGGERDRDGERRDAKRKRESDRLALEEIAPKATGREAVAEKRAARRDEARARDVSPDARPSGGGDVMGAGGEDSFAAARAREAQRAAHQQRRGNAKQEDMNRRLAEAAAVEEAKMSHFRSMLAGGPIQIAKRTDGGG
jgi:hypothetical protein